MLLSGHGGTRTARAAIPVKALNLRSSDASDAMDRVGIRGVLTGFFPLVESAPAVGPAMPVLIRRGESTFKSMREGLLDAVRMAPVGYVLVIHSETDRYSAWGGFLSQYAIMKGIRGVLVDGAARDLEEIRKLGFPVYSKARTPASGHGRLTVASVGEPVRIDSILIHQGDLVVADSDGVTIVPKSKIRQVASRVQDIKNAEKQQNARLRKV